MDIFGVSGYVILIFLAGVWALGIRTKLSTSIPTVLVGLMFAIFVIVIPVSGVGYIYSWLFIILGYLSNFVFLFILLKRIPLFYQLLSFLGSIYAGIIRIGIPKEEIKRAQVQNAKEAVERWAEKEG